MQLVQWNPFREMDDFYKSFNRGFGRLTPAQSESWAPAVNISENSKEYLVKAELPGVKKEEIKVNTNNGVLTLTGERKFDKEEKDEKHHRVEHAYGSFSRSFVLPDDVVEDKIVAECKEGIVTIRLPKTDIKKPTAIEVKVQ